MRFVSAAAILFLVAGCPGVPPPLCETTVDSPLIPGKYTGIAHMEVTANGIEMFSEFLDDFVLTIDTDGLPIETGEPCVGSSFTETLADGTRTTMRVTSVDVVDGSLVVTSTMEPAVADGRLMTGSKLNRFTPLPDGTIDFFGELVITLSDGNDSATMTSIFEANVAR